jgi:hypothetical protein
MLRTNLSTRPFYNERAVHLLLALAALVVLILTAFNAIRVVALSRQNTEFSALINRDHGEAERFTSDARRIRSGIDQEALQATADAADAANRLINRRTFSWTAFFNHIEETLPDNVMLTAVQPTFDEDRSIVQMTVLGRRTEDVDEFIQRLEQTGAFRDVLPTQQDETEEGLHRVLIRGQYDATAAVPRSPAQGDGPPPPSAAPQSDGAGREGRGARP